MAEPTVNANCTEQILPTGLYENRWLDELLTRIEQTVKGALKQPIHPDAVYDYEETVAVTGFSLSTIIRADRRGDLQGRYEGRRRYFMGRDILKWLADSEGGGNQ